MNNTTEEQVQRLREKLEGLRKTKSEVWQNFTDMPEVQSKIMMNLEAQERFILDFLQQSAAAAPPPDAR
ncbi:MAG: hypothetical protein ACT4NX_06100 [Deltaproteobacteria bacterium]